jgi:hypothetical protein
MALKKEDLSELPWERQKGESVKQYEAFCSYRDLPKPRSRDRAYRKYAQLEEGSTRNATGKFCEYMRENLWVYRTDEYDLHLERIKRHALEHKRAQSHAQRVNAYNGALALVFKKLKVLAESEGDIDMSLAEMTRLLKVAAEGLRHEYEPSKFEIEHSGEVTQKSAKVQLYQLPDNGRRRKKKSDE